MFPDEPFCAVPVETFGGVANTRKMDTRFVGEDAKTENKLSAGISAIVIVLLKLGYSHSERSF